MKTKAERKAVEDRLRELAAKNKGRLTPELVVKDARNAKSPLHGEFDWDIKKAAYKWWIEQARELIRSVHIVVKTQEYRVRIPEFVRDPDKPHEEAGYVETVSLRKDKDGAHELLVEEFSRAAAAMRRARALAAALNMENDIDEIVSNIETLSKRVEKETRV